MSLATLIGGCGMSQNYDGYDAPNAYDGFTQPTNLKTPNTVAVCRDKQCAPIKLSASKEYIFNSLAHMLSNNNRHKALVCEASPDSRVCIDTAVRLPITVGIIPANMFIDAVKITDMSVAKGSPEINLVLNYNISYNNQTPECTASRTMLYVRNADNIIMEDGGYECKMTAIGMTSVKTLITVDYVDLDYGYIGGFYSIGLSGPAKGGGTGYMLFRLPKDAFPLSPALRNPPKGAAAKKQAQTGSILDTDGSGDTSGVQVFPMGRK